MKKKYLVLQFEFNLLPNQVSETKQEFLSNQFLIYNQFMQIYNKNHLFFKPKIVNTNYLVMCVAVKLKKQKDLIKGTVKEIIIIDI